MVSKTRLAALGIAALMAVAPLAGCGSSKEEAKQTEPAKTEEPAATNTDGGAKTGSDDGAKKLTGEFEIQYFVGGYGDKWWKKSSPIFRPQIRI